MNKKDLNKARGGLKKCWDVLNSMNEFMVDVCDNPKAWRKLRSSLKDIEYGYEDYIKRINE